MPIDLKDFNIDKSGYPLVANAIYTGGLSLLRYAPATNNFQALAGLPKSSNYVSRASLAVSPNGDVAVAFPQDHNSESQLYQICIQGYNPSSGTWRLLGSDCLTSVSNQISMAFSPLSNVPYIVHDDGSQGALVVNALGTDEAGQAYWEDLPGGTINYASNSDDFHLAFDPSGKACPKGCCCLDGLLLHASIACICKPLAANGAVLLCVH